MQARAGILHQKDVTDIEAAVSSEVENAVAFAEDAPWETPTRPSLASRTDELGVSDICIEPA